MEEARCHWPRSWPAPGAPAPQDRPRKISRNGADGNPITPTMMMTKREEQANLSLAAMEAALKPRVLESLAVIAQDYAKLSEMQDSGCLRR